MKTMKKLLCIVLSLTMIFGVFSIAASAVTGAEDTEKVNVKYEIEQVSGTPLYTAVDNNVYKLTVYAKAKYGLSSFQVPIHFDKTKFAIIMIDDADIFGNMAYSYDGLYTDFEGDDLVYLFDKGTASLDTNMYTSTGTITTATRSASFIGLGNSNASVTQNQVRFVDPSNTTIYPQWLGSLSGDTTGLAFLACVYNKTNKVAYFNSYNNTLDTDWVSMGSIYFIRLPGVSEEAAIGSVFGCYADDAYGLGGLWDTSGKAMYSASYAGASPAFNVVSNATITKWSPAISKLGSQIRFNGLETGTKGSAPFDVRTRAQVSKADMITLLGTTEAGLQAALKTADIRMGFVYQATVNGSFVADDAKAAAIAGKDQGTYIVKDVKYAAFEGDDILWTCFIDDAKYDGEVIALPYIILGEEAYFLDGTITCNFSDGYDAKYADYAATQS